MNISAALVELGLPYIMGYKPYAHYQAALLEALEMAVAERPELLRLMRNAAPIRSESD